MTDLRIGSCALLCGLALALLAGPACAASKPQLVWRGVWEWSMDHRTEPGLAEIADSAADLGFNVVMCSPPQDLLAVAREQCHRRGVKLYRSTVFSRLTPELNQVLAPEDQARLPETVPPFYQSGGEPYDDQELFRNQMPCWSRPEVREHFGEMVAGYALSGVDGLAFDAVGYRDYRRCHCPVCEEALAAFRAEHPDLDAQRAEEVFAEDTMVGFINEMAAAARRANPGIELTIHIWPYFKPNPLYGNRLDVDAAGETVAWFFRPHWPMEKVIRQANYIVSHQADYYPEHLAAPFIGFFSSPGQDVRSPARVRAELQAVVDSGASAIQMAELGAIFRRSTVAPVVAEVLGGTLANGDR